MIEIIALIRFCSGDDESPLIYVEKIVLLIFCHNCLIKQNDSIIHDYNLEAFSQYIYKYEVLKICSIKQFEQCP